MRTLLVVTDNGNCEPKLPSSIAICNARSSRSSITGNEGLGVVCPPEPLVKTRVEALGVPGLVGVPVPFGAWTTYGGITLWSFPACPSYCNPNVPDVVPAAGPSNPDVETEPLIFVDEVSDWSRSRMRSMRKLRSRA
jgi:hypothetical protein